MTEEKKTLAGWTLKQWLAGLGAAVASGLTAHALIPEKEATPPSYNPYPALVETVRTPSGASELHRITQAGWEELEGNVERDSAYDYAERFRDTDSDIHTLDRLTFAGVPAEIANAYDEELGKHPRMSQEVEDGVAIKRLWEAGIHPELANAYETTNAFEVVALHNAGVTPELERQYPEGIDGKTKAELHRRGIGPDSIKQYDETLYTGGRESIVEIASEVPPEYANALANTFPPRSISTLHEAGIPVDLTTQYATTNPEEIAILHKEGISPEVANLYFQLNQKFSKPYISAENVVNFVQAGRTPEDIEEYLEHQTISEELNH